MAQRIVIWTVPRDLTPPGGESISIDLDPTELAATHPGLAAQLGGGRIVSHTIHAVIKAFSGPDYVMTFIVDDLIDAKKSPT
jgi:hypothetical protein